MTTDNRSMEDRLLIIETKVDYLATKGDIIVSIADMERNISVLKTQLIMWMTGLAFTLMGFIIASDIFLVNYLK